MPHPRSPFRNLVITAAALALSACATSYTGPIEVTRFVAEEPTALGKGTIGLEFPDEITNLNARNAFAAAIADELSRLGYQVVLDGSQAVAQTASIRTSRNELAAASSRGPVDVGVGGSTGSYGSGLGVGIGINLGGASSGPNVLTELSVRIRRDDGTSLWEGRAQQPISVNSPLSDIEASAQALATALFQDFPGGSGETIAIDVDELTHP